MSRSLLACLVLSGLACRTPRAEQHFQNELSYLVPYVDVHEEEKAVRAIFAQRKLLVEDVLRGEGYVALSAVSLDRNQSAVRVITRRGVVVGEDGDVEELFGLGQVALLASLSSVAERQPLLGVLRTARGQTDGCVVLYRLIEDGRALPVSVHVERFGSRACVSELSARGDGTFAAAVAWPTLSGLASPRLEVDMAFETQRIGQAPQPALSLHVVEDGGWLDREAKRAAQPLLRSAPFSARYALGVTRAALALASGRSTDMQLAEYHGALGRILPGSPEAEMVAETSAHIERGWTDEQPVAAELEADAGEPPEADALVIEPEPRP